MSTRVEALWHPRPDAYGPRRHRKPCRYSAYVPDALTTTPIVLSGEAAADVSDVERSIASFDARAHAQHDLERLARFLLRAEAVASSKIEGLQVNTRRLARHEAYRGADDAAHDVDRSARPARRHADGTAEAVLGNVEAMELAVTSVSSAAQVRTAHLLQIHRALMRHSDRPEFGGVVRTEQNWIGGNDFNPCFATFVPPPPDRVQNLLADLCEFINRDDLPALVQAALAHAQFETIHPFADGNGRTGRALIHVVLRRRGLATAFVPPISLVLATRVSSYLAGLTAYRYDAEPDSEEAADGIREWLEVFVAATARATEDAVTLCDRMVDLEERWRQALQPRRGSTADRTLPLLISQPVVAARDLESLLKVSRQAAAQAIGQLVDADIVRQIGGGQRNRMFEAWEVFNVLTDYERAMATDSGDTRIEQPGRPVPFRVQSRQEVLAPNHQT